VEPGNGRAIGRLALARALSVTGSNAAAIALSYEVYQQTDSPVWLSASLFFTLGVTGLLAPFAGVLVDRADRKRVLIASDAAGALCWLALAFVDQPVHLIGLGFLASVAELPFVPASGAAVPNLVEGEQALARANSRLAAANHVGHLLGPSLGGLLVTGSSAGTVFVLNALSSSSRPASSPGSRGPSPPSGTRPRSTPAAPKGSGSWSATRSCCGSRSPPRSCTWRST
jgi:MFS family permease